MRIGRMAAHHSSLDLMEYKELEKRHWLVPSLSISFVKLSESFSLNTTEKSCLTELSGLVVDGLR